jgi:hypothetical protein
MELVLKKQNKALVVQTQPLEQMSGKVNMFRKLIGNL